ncbi:MAG: hypothetical protein HY049_10660 [Acidobacteria bacterium]|nr:hypothetical protein [Acidobacteriota bacterium]
MTARTALHLALAAALVTAGGAAAPKAEILGTWSGTSVCVKSPDFPSCTDEVVVYEVRDLPDKAGSVLMQADKIVNGARGTMGDLELTYAAADGAWTYELRTPRAHALWSFTVSAGKMTGTLVEIPSRKRIRNVQAERTAHDSGSRRGA